jgi:hypothetical protein
VLDQVVAAKAAADRPVQIGTGGSQTQLIARLKRYQTIFSNHVKDWNTPGTHNIDVVLVKYHFWC